MSSLTHHLVVINCVVNAYTMEVNENSNENIIFCILKKNKIK